MRERERARGGSERERERGGGRDAGKAEKLVNGETGENDFPHTNIIVVSDNSNT